MALMHRNDIEIHFEEAGSGHPLLLFAPGGMNSTIGMWRASPADPTQKPPWIDPAAVLSDELRVIAMDQRNSGESRAPVGAGDGWHSYTQDHIALLDHLGIERAHLMGGCIGSSYALALCAAAPERVTAAVLQNPIGLSADNRASFFGMVDHWGHQLQARRDDVSAESVAALRDAMFGGDFVFSVTRDFVRSCQAPLLVLPGDDAFHPEAVAREIVELAPNARLVPGWKGPAPETTPTIRDFLREHAPGR